MKNSLLKQWEDIAKKVLLNRKIVQVEYVKEEYTGHYGICFVLDNGTIIFPMSDDEGNDVGALHFRVETEDRVIPVIRHASDGEQQINF